MRRFLLPILCVVACASLAAPAHGDEPGSDLQSMAEVMATTLGIEGTEEAALLVVADVAVDRLQVGVREIVLPPAEEGERVFRLVREQREGLIAVTVARGELLWEGQVRTLAGVVTVFDLEVALRSPEASSTAGEEFDLFAFYDELDAREKEEDQLAWCEETLARVLSDADRRVVSETCGRIQSVLDAALAEPVDEDELTEALLEEPEDDDLQSGGERRPTDIELLYRPDGRPRLVARGTLPRVLVAVGTGLGTAVSVVAACDWERRAEEEYVLYRAAERISDDSSMTRHLFFSQRYDRSRDAAIVVGSVLLTATVVTLVLQAAQERSFRKRQARAAAGSGD